MTYRLLITAILFCCTGNIYPKGYAILIGADSIKRNAYTASYGLSAVAGAKKDVEKMNEILLASGFSDIRILTGRQATREAILAELNKIKNIIKGNDVLAFFYSGHGDTLTDIDNDEIPYTYDQVFVTYNRFLVDDDLNKVWKSFPKNVKIYQIVDACFSGEMYRIATFLSTNLKSVNNYTFDINTENSCRGLDVTQPYNMYYVASARKNSTVLAGAGGEGILVNDMYGAFNKLKRENKLQHITAAEFFSLVCTGSSKFVFIKIHADTDSFKNDYLFKL